MKARIQFPLQEVWSDYPDNSNNAVVVYFSGCSHNCENCQNKELQDPDFGEEIEDIELAHQLNIFCKKIFTKKIVLSGGDPLYQNNLVFTRKLLDSLKQYDICIYTGYDIEYVIAHNVKGFSFIKCGKFIQSKSQTSEKTDSYIQFASKNQILYNSNFEKISQDGIYYF